VNRGSVARVCIYNKKDIYKLYDFLYNDATIFLERKYEKFKSIINDYNWEKINHIKYSKFKYITLDKRRNTWIVRKKENGKNKTFGYFKKESDAINLSKQLF